MIGQAMIPTYKATLRGNRLEWRGDVRKHIPADRAVTVYVTFVDESSVETEGGRGKAGRGNGRRIDAPRGDECAGRYSRCSGVGTRGSPGS